MLPDAGLSAHTIANTALISHPLYIDAIWRSEMKDLVLLSSTETSLMLHPKYSSQNRITALIPVNVKSTALMVHPYFSMTTGKELAIVPPRPILRCKTVELHPSDRDSLLVIIMLNRHINNQDHRHCTESEHPDIEYCSINQDQQVSTVKVCPLQATDSVEDLKINDKIEQLQITTQDYRMDIPGLVLGGNNDIYIILAAMIILLMYRLVTGGIKSFADWISVLINQGEYAYYYGYAAPHQQMSNESGPKVSQSSPHIQENDVESMTAGDDQLQKCGTSDTELSLTTHSTSIMVRPDSTTETLDSGFGSLPLQPETLQLPSHNQQSTSENYDSGLGRSREESFISRKDESISSADIPNHVKSLGLSSEQDELDDGTEDYNVQDEMALEAGLPCFSDDQPLTMCLHGNLLNHQECDSPSDLVSLDSEQFGLGIVEEGPQEPNLPCLSKQIDAATAEATLTGAVNQHSINTTAGINHSIAPDPITINYNDHLYPRNEVEINMKLEGSETMYGVAVTVESSMLQDLCSLAIALPSNIDITRPFIHQYGGHDYSAESLQDYSNPVQATNGK